MVLATLEGLLEALARLRCSAQQAAIGQLNRHVAGLAR